MAKRGQLVDSMARPKRKKTLFEGPADYPQPDTAPLTHERVLSLLEEEKRGRILDMATGQGALAEALKEQKFEVFTCDIERTFQFEDVSWVRWDLNSQQIPFEMNFFDYVACVEVIEHIENPHQLIRSIKHILRSGGKLILTTPNILSIRSRITFALSGRFAFFPPEDETHINPVPLWELERILRDNGFEIEVVTNNRYDRSGWLFSLLLYPLLKPKIRALLGGNSLIVKARKEKEVV